MSKDGGPVKLNDAERTVLQCFVKLYDEFFYGFNTISADSGLDRKIVRRACRSLARKGLAEYSRALMDEDGHVVGAGYACTKLGRDVWWAEMEKSDG